MGGLLSTDGGSSGSTDITGSPTGNTPDVSPEIQIDLGSGKTTVEGGTPVDTAIFNIDDTDKINPEAVHTAAIAAEEQAAIVAGEQSIASALGAIGGQSLAETPDTNKKKRKAVSKARLGTKNLQIAPVSGVAGGDGGTVNA